MVANQFVGIVLARQGLQTGNPGFPGFTHGGYVITAAIDLKWRF